MGGAESPLVVRPHLSLRGQTRRCPAPAVPNATVPSPGGAQPTRLERMTHGDQETTATLRRWAADDDDALHRAVTASVDLRVQFGNHDLSTPEACRRYIEDQLAKESASARHFAVDLNGEAVGSIGVTSMEFNHGTAWISYWVSSDARGLGLATRGLAAVSTWAFSEGLFRLELGHRVNNPASCKVATRAGFPAEGVERAKLRYGIDRFDVETHARLASDPAPDLDPVGALRLTGG